MIIVLNSTQLFTVLDALNNQILKGNDKAKEAKEYIQAQMTATIANTMLERD